ncbi:MAG: radical SAM family heme chaperone HemW [Candidatus Gastranaerophilales bacterium]|nr:radical SAM family heme chaperone HemW [Candidatus Gastranaerophilales bacterium]
MINCTYLHIPFCTTKCFYCAFCSFPLLRLKNDYIGALIKEIKYYYKNNYQKTIYFGGGTPSLLNIDELEKILNCFNFDKNTSITLEANPCELTREKLENYKKLGINRISLGVQNFDDDILKSLNRNHTKNDIFNAVENILCVGFKDFSIDLMYGLANQNLKQWEDTLNIALGLDINHISLYGLKIEKGTKFHKFPPKNLPDNDIQADMYKLACEMLSEKFKHYEFSNFAKSEKHYSKHNLAYWKRENYYGFGLSASGFIDNKRYTNTVNFKNYTENPTGQNYEVLNFQEQIEEEIFLGLRLSEGINFSYLNKKYNIDIYKKYEKQFEKFLKAGFMQKTKNGIKLTLEGVLLSNEILCEFID